MQTGNARSRRGTLLVLAFAVLGVVVGFLVATRYGGSTSVPAVVRGVRELRRLETITYHVEKVVDLADRQSALFGLIESRDVILFVAVGDVTAGLDLADFGPEDVRIDRRSGTVTVRLPRPIILQSRLDNQSSYVHSRNTSLLAKRNESLETRARQAAEREIVQAAIASGILAQAQSSAERQLSALLGSFGARRVAIEWHE